jgi:GNAT superfamily N-acetyltransferase
MKIQPITDRDLPAVLDIYQQCEDFLALGPNPRASLEMVAADRALSAAQNGIFCGIFEPDGMLLGVLDFIPKGYHGVPNCAYLELLMLAAPARSRGVGAQALSWLEGELRSTGITRLEAGVQVNNPRAIRFWQNHGFMICGPSEVLPDGTECYPLVKTL